jgi:hypothetical protein
MNRKIVAHTPFSQELAEAAARILVEEGQTDYRIAKQKAAERLGVRALAENSEIHEALIRYQQLYGGADYWQQLKALREAAVQALQFLSEFNPRAVGGVVTGAITSGSRLQIHAVCEQAELVDIFLDDRRIPFEQDDRDYRFPDGRSENIPLVCFEAGSVGIDVAIFEPGQPSPISPTQGKPFQRVKLPEMQRLLAETSLPHAALVASQP